MTKHDLLARGVASTIGEDLSDLTTTLNETNAQLSEKANQTALETEIIDRTNAVITEKNERLAEVAVERARINNFTTLASGSTTGDAELIDARIGADGVTYANVGAANRGQFGKLKGSLDSFIKSPYSSSDVMEKGYYKSDKTKVLNEGTSFRITKKFIVSPTDIVTYSGLTTLGGAPVSAFLDSNDNVLFTFKQLTGENTLFVPKNATKIVFSISVTDINTFNITIRKVYTLDEANKVVDAIKEQIITDNTVFYKDSLIIKGDSSTATNLKIPIYDIEEGIYTLTIGTVTGNMTTRIAELRTMDASNIILVKSEMYESNHTVQVTVTSNTSYIMIVLTATYNLAMPYENTAFYSDIRLVKGDAHTVTLKPELLNYTNSNDILYEKKYFVGGDSFTQGYFDGFVDENGLTGQNSPVLYDAVRGMYKTYPWWISERNNMTLIKNAYTGSTMALTKDYVDNPTTVDINTGNPFSYQRYLSIPVDADYVTLWFGVNDASRCYLGTINDTTNATFYGAWNFVLKWLRENRPLVKVGIIVTPDSNLNFRNAIRECAKKWGYPTLDFFADANVPLIYGREDSFGISDELKQIIYNTYRISATNSHPNIYTHEYQSTIVENFMRSI